IRFYLGAVYEELKEFDSAIIHFNKILPSSTYYSESVVHVAYLYKLRGDANGAKKLMREAIAARDDIPQLYAFYASLLDESREFKPAITMLEGGVKKFPDNTQLRFFLGTMYDRIGEQGRSMEEMREVLKLDGEHVQAMNYIAFTYAEEGKNLD